MVVIISPMSGFINVQVDSSTPGARRKQPYCGQLHQWAKNNLQKGIYVIVFVNDKATLIMPDQEVLLGPMQPTDGIAVRRGGDAYEARLIPGGVAIPPIPAAGLEQGIEARDREMSRRKLVFGRTKKARFRPTAALRRGSDFGMVPADLRPPSWAGLASFLCACRVSRHGRGAIQDLRQIR